MNHFSTLLHFGRMVLICTLIAVSWSSIVHGQNSGLKISIEYGIDRDISSYLHELGTSSILVPIDQVNSFQPTNLVFTYVHPFSKLDVHFIAGLMTRKIRNFDHLFGFTNHYYNTQYFLGIGIGQKILDRNPFAINLCLDFLFCYQDSETTLLSSLRSEHGTFIEPYASYRKIDFGSTPKKIVPMFAPVIEGSYELSSGNRLLLGLGMIGQFAKTYSFRMKAIESRPGQIISYESRSSKFSMFYPFVRAGVQF